MFALLQQFHAVVVVLMALLSSSLIEVQARPTDSSILPFRNLKRTSSSTNILQTSAEKTGLKPGAVSSIQMQPTGHNVGQAAENQEVLLSGDGAGFNTTSLPRSVNKNPCIKRFRYTIIYNYFYPIPICKKHQGCYEVKKIVNFGKGRTLAITYDCKKLKQLP